MTVQSSPPVELDVRVPVWGRVHTVAPLVLVGTREPDGSFDLAPKHLAMPLGLQDWFGFGGHYESMGTFTYTAHVDGTQASWSNTVNTTPPGMGDTITVQYGNVDYDFTRVQEQ